MSEPNRRSAASPEIPLPLGVFALLAVVLGFWLTLRDPSFSPIASVSFFWMRLRPLLAAGAVFAAAFLTGRLFLERLRPHISSGAAYVCLCFGLGLGLLGLIMLLLGLAGGFNRPAAGVLLLAALATSLVRRPVLSRALVGVREHWLRLRLDGPSRLILFVLAGYALLIALDSYAPVVGFDAAEYHLGGVREYIKAGRIGPIEGNFYTALPFQVEMLFGLGLLFEGDPTGLSPKMINLLLFLLCNAAMFALAGHVTRRRSLQLFACLLFAVHPLIFKVSLMPNNDLGLTLFVALLLLSWLEWLREGRRVHLVLAGVFTGFALGCKYTAIGMILFPALLALLPAGFLAWRELHAESVDPAFSFKRFIAFFSIAKPLFLLPALLLFLPWALKNIIFYGNPLYPLLPGLFPNPSFSVHQYQFYWRHYGGAAPASADFWLAAFDRLHNYGALFWLPFLGAAAIRCGRIRGWALVLFVILGHLACALLTNNPDRFQAPLLPAMILGLLLVWVRLVEAVHENGRHSRAAWLTALFAIWAVLSIHYNMARSLSDRSPMIQHALGVPKYKGRWAFLEAALGKPAARAYRYAEEKLPRKAGVLLVYDAQWYFFPQRVVANTVFDRSALVRLAREANARDGKTLLQYLRRRGIDFVFVNEFELVRAIRGITPERYLAREFPGVTPEKVRAALAAPAAMPLILQHWTLYPPYLPPIEPDFQRWRPAIEEFMKLAEARRIFESNPSPAPLKEGRIWIADLRERAHSTER